MPDVSAILQLEIPFIVRLGERAMTLGDVMGLAPGAIIELDKGADEELDILVNNKQIGAGQAVKVGENFGVRISFIGDLRQRILAMGGPEDDGLAPQDADLPD
ncbi:MAG: FliM/FliN family flagellar motor switch protein [Phycisphaerales bacterium JB039]